MRPLNFLHNHPKLEESLELDNNHVIVDRKDWEEACQELNYGKCNFPLTLIKEDKLFTEKDLREHITNAYKDGIKQGVVMEAGLEGDDTDAYVNWVLLKLKKNE